jgi:hypothetical protein
VKRLHAVTKGGLKETTENFGSRFEYAISRIGSRSANHSNATFYSDLECTFSKRVL